MIHGLPARAQGIDVPGDWTNGCISVDNHAIEEIYASVKDGTPIMIVP
jgi:lipoprotein-anchoring transpeptidase ErfK/SrfK